MTLQREWRGREAGPGTGHAIEAEDFDALLEELALSGHRLVDSYEDGAGRVAHLVGRDGVQTSLRQRRPRR